MPRAPGDRNLRCDRWDSDTSLADPDHRHREDHHQELSQVSLVDVFTHGQDKLVLRVEKIPMEPLVKLAVYERYLL